MGKPVGFKTGECEMLRLFILFKTGDWAKVFILFKTGDWEKVLKAFKTGDWENEFGAAGDMISEVGATDKLVTVGE
jgi:hypothetical protein